VFTGHKQGTDAAGLQKLPRGHSSQSWILDEFELMLKVPGGHGSGVALSDVQ
jgi:hypothetical protein